MTPTRFKQSNVTFAKDQPEYEPLPAYSDEEQVISRWKLTWRERVNILFGKPIWIHVMSFGKPLQPIYPTLDNPFNEDK